MRRAIVLIVFLLAAVAHAGESFGGYRGVKAGWVVQQAADVSGSRVVTSPETIYSASPDYDMWVQIVEYNSVVPINAFALGFFDGVNYWQSGDQIIPSAKATYAVIVPRGGTGHSYTVLLGDAPSNYTVSQWTETPLTTSSVPYRGAIDSLRFVGLGGAGHELHTSVDGTVFQNTRSTPVFVWPIWGDFAVSDVNEIRVGPSSTPPIVGKKSTAWISAPAGSLVIVPAGYWSSLACSTGSTNCSLLGEEGAMLQAGDAGGYRGIASNISMIQSANLAPSGTAARAYGTAYQNLTGAPMWFMPTSLCPENQQFSIGVGSTSSPAVVAEVSAGTPGGSDYLSHTQLVGNGQWYKVTADAGCTLDLWYEWTFQ